MTKDKAFKLRLGDKIKKSQTGEIYIFQEFVTFDLEPPFGWGPTVYCKLEMPNGTFGFIQPRDMGPFEVVDDE